MIREITVGSRVISSISVDYFLGNGGSKCICVSEGEKITRIRWALIIFRG